MHFFCQIRTDLEYDENLDEDGRSSKTHSEISNYSTVKPEKTASSKRRTFTPQYVGESNAFAIQLFCIEEKYESRSIDFLQRAFEMFPDKDFCIITLPPNVPEFNLIQNFFVINLHSIKPYYYRKTLYENAWDYS